MIQFKKDTKDLPAAFGQIITRCRPMYDNQPQRKSVLAVAMSCSDVQLFLMEEDKLSKTFDVYKTEVLSLTISTGTSSDSRGVSMIARLLAANKHAHNFTDPVLPAECMVNERWLYNFEQLRTGTTTIAAVFKASWERYHGRGNADDVIIKTGMEQHEVSISPALA